MSWTSPSTAPMTTVPRPPAASTARCGVMTSIAAFIASAATSTSGMKSSPVAILAPASSIALMSASFMITAARGARLELGAREIRGAVGVAGEHGLPDVVDRHGSSSRLRDADCRGVS